MKTLAIWSLRKYRESTTGNICDPMTDAEEGEIRHTIAHVIGMRIKEIREDRHWSQEYLGIVLGVHRNTIFRWESGESAIDAVSLYCWCSALDISPATILRLVTMADNRDQLPAAAAGYA